MSLDIALECKPDEALLKCLGFTSRQITHQPNKGQVFVFLNKQSKAVGMVDEDPGSAEPGYFKNYQFVEEQHRIAVYLDPNRGNKLIVIKPRLEEWILETARLSGVDATKYSLPAKGHDLHKIINTRLNNFSDFVKAISAKESKALEYLKSGIDSF